MSTICTLGRHHCLYTPGCLHLCTHLDNVISYYIIHSIVYITFSLTHPDDTTRPYFLSERWSPFYSTSTDILGQFHFSFSLHRSGLLTNLENKLRPSDLNFLETRLPAGNNLIPVCPSQRFSSQDLSTMRKLRLRNCCKFQSLVSCVLFDSHFSPDTIKRITYSFSLFRSFPAV